MEHWSAGVGRAHDAAMLVIVTWWWGNKFDISHVDKLAAGVRRNLTIPHKFACIHDRGYPAFSEDVHYSWPILDQHLTKVPGCFARLRMFDPEWWRVYPANRDIYGALVASTLVSMDLDTVVTGSLDELLVRNEPFVIMQGGNASNPCPYNGALMMLRAGAHPEVWSDFSLEAAAKTPHAPGWRCGVESGVYVYRKPGWPGGDALPEDARLVTFIRDDPAKLTRLAWVRENWR